MHHCLEVTEILVNIFEHCADDWRCKLLPLALTCKYFLEPSLNALWGGRRSVVELLKTFPSDAWRQSGDPPRTVSFD
jgi:hypothetical protein